MKILKKSGKIMNAIIIYGSHYGTTQHYAQMLSMKTHIPMMNYKNIQDLSSYDIVIHIGALYAGGVLGLKKTLKNISFQTQLIVITVGLADVNDLTNRQHIRQSIQQYMSNERYESLTIFHLRGGIYYQKLSFPHKTMMKLLYNQVKKIPADQQNAEQKAMIETYGKEVSFVDEKSLDPIIDYLKKK